MSGLSEEEASSLAAEWVGHIIQRDLLISNEQCETNYVSAFGADMIGLQTTTTIPMGVDGDSEANEIDEILFLDHCSIASKPNIMPLDGCFADEMKLASGPSVTCDIPNYDSGSNAVVLLSENGRISNQSAPQDIPSHDRCKSKLNPFSAVFTPSPRQVWQEDNEVNGGAFQAKQPMDCLTCGNANSISTNWCDNCGVAFCRDQSLDNSLAGHNGLCSATYPPTYGPMSPQQHICTKSQNTGFFFSNDCVMLTDELRNLTISSMTPMQARDTYWTNIYQSEDGATHHDHFKNPNFQNGIPNTTSMSYPSCNTHATAQYRHVPRKSTKRRSKKSNKNRSCSMKSKQRNKSESNFDTVKKSDEYCNVSPRPRRAISLSSSAKLDAFVHSQRLKNEQSQPLLAGLSLPNEIVFCIFTYLSPVDLVKCCLVCRQFNSLASCDTLWKSKPIHLKRCKVNDGILSKAARKSPSSFSLTYCDCKSVTETGVSQFFKVCGPNLKEFSVGNCNNSLLPNVPILTSMLPHSHHLISVDLSWCTIDESGIRDLADTIKRLEVLRLSGCQEMSDNTIQHICQKHGDSLRVLELFGCFKLSNGAMYHVAENCRRLETLKIGQCYKVCESGLDHIVWKSVGLQELDLRGVKKLVDNTVKKIATNLSMLSTLVLANCPLISDASVLAVAEKMHLIRVLDVCGCCRITDKSLHELAANCPMIEALDVSSTKVTSLSVSALAHGSCKKLSSLKLSFCSRITLSSLTDLVTECKSLKLLHLFGCKGVRNTTQLNQINPLLEVQQ